jgi:hypothetical protein
VSSVIGRTLLALFALAALCVGCGSSDTQAPAPATFTEIYPLIFPITTRAQCSFCHGLPPNATSNGRLSTGMDRAAAYAALVGPVSTSAKCGGPSYVVPGQPEQSLLLSKLMGATCGDRMPLGGDPLPAAQLEMIRSWIAAGAKDD